jgi:hypothetical protein
MTTTSRTCTPEGIFATPTATPSRLRHWMRAVGSAYLRSSAAHFHNMGSHTPVHRVSLPFLESARDRTETQPT